MTHASAAAEACSIPCNLCGGTDVAELSTRGRDEDYLRTVCCTACGLAWTDPRPAEDEVKDYYEKEYRLSYKGTYTPKMKHVLRAGRNALGRFERIEKYLRPGARVLDCGAGGGEFLYLLKTRGYDVSGVEPNQGYGEYAAAEYEMDIHIGFIQRMAFDPASFDLVTIFHVLEHTEDPLGVLRQLHSWIRPGGTLVVEVPNVENVAQTPVSRFHLAHLYSFNPYTLEKLGERAGLKVRDVHLSADKVNLTVYFGVPDTPVQEAAPDACRNPDNARRVISAVRGHTSLSHLLSRYPYTRLFGRLLRGLEEKWQVRDFICGRDLLDGLYSRKIN